jgi:hypothetical protein
MATIVLSAAGAAFGSGFGGSVLGLSGAVLGRAVGATVGRSIDQKILGGGSEAVEVGKVDQFRLTSVGYGAPIPEAWGRMRVAGQIIWASRFKESVRRSSGSKGTAKQATKTYSYSVSLAIALTRGTVSSMGRIWADGVEIPRLSINLQFYPGSEDQLPDPLIEAVEGIGNAPSYRGICYLVIEELNLAQFGNRVPQFSFEIVRRAQDSQLGKIRDLPTAIRGVALIPGSGEYSLATTPVDFRKGLGQSQSANVHSLSGQADLKESLDQLKGELPECNAVSLVVSWFGNDLRCSFCKIEPKVDQAMVEAAQMPWTVSSMTRATAATVPLIGGKPIYGGTPTDQSVIEAIRELRSRGKDVMFYPFILMDQVDGNTLPDPWSDQIGQPQLPWRGRITLQKATGQPGSNNKTSAAASEVQSFLGVAQPADFTLLGDTVSYHGPNEWGFRRFILHYAHLCAIAGGVESFCIGSELRGLTQIRSSEADFPMVNALIQLAQDVKSILGSQTRVSYAADWSEYFGLHEDGDVIFHLDSLWSSEHIDFIGIDNYMPISDWRDNAKHLDAGYESIYNLDYLKLGIAGGEGYDWYYDSPEASDFQKRKVIVDAEYGEDWVFRYKDIRGWWESQHFNRISGIRQSTPTYWIPASKPIRFTEYGCAAVDKGSNEPNRFFDAKSSESSLPRSSNGGQDEYIQFQYLLAMAQFWGDEANNPVSAIYAHPMLDLDHCYVWAWDARPFPEFPGNSDAWSDGENYGSGHWINGRSANQSLSAVVTELVGTEASEIKCDFSRLDGLVRGYAVSQEDSSRAKIQSLSLSYSFDLTTDEGLLSATSRSRSGRTVLALDAFVASKELESGVEFTHAANANVPGRIQLRYLEANNNFESLATDSSFPDETSHTTDRSEIGLLLTRVEALGIADRWLSEARLASVAARINLPPSKFGIVSGQIVSLNATNFRVDRKEETDFLALNCVRTDLGAITPSAMKVQIARRFPPLAASKLFSTFLDLPLISGAENPIAARVAVTSNPWVGSATVWISDTDASYLSNVELPAYAAVGTLSNEFKWAPSNVWDRSSVITVELVNGELQSVSEDVALNGANLAAIGDGTPDGWEIIQFATATLVADRTYEIRQLLRGVAGSDATTPLVHPSGSIFVLLDENVPQLDLLNSTRGLERYYRIGKSSLGYTDTSVNLVRTAFAGNGLRPFTVSHLDAQVDDFGAVVITWIRRTRIDGDSWQSIEVPLGEEVESYTIKVKQGATLVRTATSSTQTWSYTLTMQSMDGLIGTVTFEVAQSSISFGDGPFRQTAIELR